MSNTIIQEMRDRWGISGSLTTDEHRQPGDCISTYFFAEVLGQSLCTDDVLTTGCSGLATEIFQLAVALKPERELICSWSLGAMGFGPPTAIGACIGSGRKRTICVDGEGGFQLNVQELATIRGLNLPIKMFVLNNGGYASIRVSQERWFGRTFGADEKSGLHLPALENVAAAYDIPFMRLDGWTDLHRQISTALNTDGPLICEVPSPPTESRPPAPVNVTGWTPTTRFR